MKKPFCEHHLLKILNSFELGSIPLDLHLSQYFRQNSSLGSKDRKYISEKIYALIRWLGLVDHFCEEDHSWEERVDTLKQINMKQKQGDVSIPPHVRLSFPKSIYQLLLSQYGEKKTEEICLFSNTQAPTTIRVNLLKTTRKNLLEKWQNQFLTSPTSHSIWGINFTEKINFSILEDFKKGLFEIQDEASQLVSDLIDAKPGDLILDYCAGAGGKTLAFAHKLQGKGQIYLHDIREVPLLKGKKRLKRAGIENGQILYFNSPNKKNLKGKMDWIIVDVPCTGSGTLRRNPDLKWRFSPEMLNRLIDQQREIFNEALPFLAPHGKIVYATCSILSQENEKQVDYFQETHSLDLTSPPFRSLPTKGGMDGFFGAVLRRSENLS